MPERIEDSLLVIVPFKAGDVEYERGDRVPVHHRSIRRLARSNPEFFRMEFVPIEVDLAWLAELDAEHDGRWRQLLKNREEAEKAKQRALREELAQQDEVHDPALERAYRKQEKEREQREKQQRDERERERVDRSISLQSGLN